VSGGAPPGIDLAYCFDFADTEPEPALHRLKSYGFQGIELWPRWIESFGIDRWSLALRETGMTCFQLCPYFDFVHGDEGIDASRAELRRFLEYAEIVECRRLRAFTGPVAPDRAVGAAQATPEQWASAIAGLRDFCDAAAPRGVELCLECHEGMLTETSAGALRLIEGVGRPNLTTNLQLPLQDEGWEDSIAALGRYTTHLHLHNWIGPMVLENSTFLSAGEFDWEPALRRLARDWGRRVCVSLEHSTHCRKHDSWETAERDGPFLRALRQRVMAG
jgi:sugar phosphate isomerase/epimerase